MGKRETEEIRKSMNNCSMRLRAMVNLLGENKPRLNQKFNQILIEKAILREKLIQSETSVFLKLAKKLIPKQNKELICDYFK